MFAQIIRQTSNDLSDALLLDIMARVNAVDAYNHARNEMVFRLRFLADRRKELTGYAHRLQQQVIDYHIPNEDDALFYNNTA